MLWSYRIVLSFLSLSSPWNTFPDLFCLTYQYILYFRITTDISDMMYACIFFSCVTVSQGSCFKRRTSSPLVEWFRSSPASCPAPSVENEHYDLTKHCLIQLVLAKNFCNISLCQGWSSCMTVQIQLVEGNVYRFRVTGPQVIWRKSNMVPTPEAFPCKRTADDLLEDGLQVVEINPALLNFVDDKSAGFKGFSLQPIETSQQVINIHRN